MENDDALIDGRLPATEIHIWQASLDGSSVPLQQFAALLSIDEQQRAQRFRFAQHHRRYVVSRGILRMLLGDYLKTSPAALEFCYGHNGKPALAIATAGLVFNVSHSEDLMLCAIARHCEVGIDLEFVRPVEHLDRLTQRFFSAREHAAIHQLSGEQQLQRFFQHWTCKEALLKAIGAQLTSLSTIEVGISDHTATVVSWGCATAQPVQQWSLQLFMPSSQTVAAVAVNAPARGCVFRQWPVDCL